MLGEKKKVLVIDDEPTVTKILRRLLALNNFEVMELNDPLKLEDYILFTDYDLVITDLVMPGRGGAEVLKIIRHSKPNIPVIVLTGQGTVDSAIQSMKLGAAEFLIKPVNNEQLLQAVNKHARADAVMNTKMKNFLAKKIQKKTSSPLEDEKIALKEEIISTNTIPDGFVEVEFEGVVPGERIPFDLYIQIFEKHEDKYYLRRLCKANAEYTSGIRNMLYQRRLASAFIHEKDYRAYYQYYSRLKSLAAFQADRIKDKKKMVLYGKAVEAAAQILSQPVGDNNINKAVYLVDDIFKTMVKDPDVFQDMYLLFKQDTSVFNHSVNVCLLVSSFGIYIGLSEEYIKILGLGAIFHDLGLSKVDKAVLDKQDALTKSEWAQIAEHPIHGVNLLKSSMLYPSQALRIVGEHHEKSDGTGYPRALTGNQISSLSRLVSIVDKFDSMTTEKPYRAAFLPAQALKQIYIEEPSPKYKILIQKFIGFLGGRKPTAATSQKILTPSK